MPDKMIFEEESRAAYLEMVARFPFPSLCPCCGEDRKYPIREGKEYVGIRFGCTGAMSYGVECHTCGLNIERELPERMPRKIKTMLELYVETYRIALEAWNRRS